MAGLALAAALAATARAAPDSPWRKLADPVFHEVAQNADIPNALIPLSMTEGPDGFLWLAGDSGLLRWDGYQFRAYPAQPKLADGIRNEQILELHRDRAKQLWVGTETSGLARYDPGKDRLICVPLSGPQCGLDRVSAIADDGAGGLWVGTDTGLVRLDAAGAVKNRLRHDAGQPASLPDDAILAVQRDRAGTLWIGTHMGLARSTDDGAHFATFAVPGEPAPAVSRLMEDSAGRLWVGTRQHGVFVIDAARAAARIVPGTQPLSATDTAIDTNALLEISPDRIWIGTDGHGIIAVDARSLETSSIRHDPDISSGLPGDTVQSLYRDSSGLVWVGTDSGLASYNTHADGIITLFGNRRRSLGLSDESIMSLYAAPDGRIWTGSQGGGFNIIDTSGHRTLGLAGHRVFALVAAPAPLAGVLLGTDSGLFIADPSGLHVTHIMVPNVPPNTDLRSLRTIKDAVWAAGRENGVWQLKIDAALRVTVLRHETAPRLTNSVVEVIAETADGKIAIATDDGFNLLDPVSGAMERVVADPANPRGLDAGYIGAIGTDLQGRLWLGNSSGIDIWEGRDAAGRPQFRRIGTDDGLPAAAIDGLRADRAGNMWVSTDREMAVVAADGLTVRTVRRADGLAITNYWSESVATLPDGDIAFGGNGGVTIIRADAVLPWQYRPPVVVTAARVGNERVPVGAGARIPLTVHPEMNTLSVEFAALDFSAPMMNRYRYKLEGFDADWTDTDAAHRSADYTNLPPGHYVLRIGGSNRNGVWSEPETTVQVTVLPAWFQTVWFRAGAFTTLAILTAFGLSRWTEVLRRRQRDLQLVVASRTVELSESQQQLRQANAVLEMRVIERTQDLAERTEALEASEARFRAWFDHAQDAMVVVKVHPDGSFTYEALNPAVERMFGVKPEDGIGRRPDELLRPGFAATVLKRYQQAAGGESIRYETKFDGPFGERLLDTWVAPVWDAANGRVTRLVGASRDMTDRRALEARLAQAQKLQALGGLAGGIAHDFNNILQAIAGAATLMEMRPDDPAKILRLARNTISATERGTSITRRLLAFARSDSLRVEAIPTADVLEGVVEVLKYTLGAKIGLVAALAPALPPLLADRGQLETALVNLGTNARDAMPAGGTLTLAAETEVVAPGDVHHAGLAPGAYIRIEVRDTGTGMDAVTLGRAIEPFFTTKPQGQGTGLGLALVKGFAEQSGGQMALTSVAGQGTTVSLWLPQAGARPTPPAAEPPMRPAAHGANARVLVVDDDELVREMIAEQLEDAGFNVLRAESGNSALDMIRSGPTPDALVCDLSMPEIDGIETIRRARALLPALCCFLLTGYAGERAALDTGDAFTLLRKPISASALISEIEAGLTAVQA